MTRRAFLGAAALLALACGCRARVDRCSDPVAVARSFVEAMGAHDAETALQFVSRASRERLELAAKTASGILGQEVTAAEMLVPERSMLARPEWLVLASGQGDEMFVEVRPPADAGVDGDGPWGVQRMVREDGCWKVALLESAAEVPPVPPSEADAAAPDAGP